MALDCVNYEFDCRAFIAPFAPDHRHARGELPFTGGIRSFPSDPRLVALACKASISETPLVRGRLLSGSEFMTTARKAEMGPVWKELDDPAVGPPLAVDMECAGVAQICLQYKLPFLGLRAVSDTTEGDANADFNEFCQNAADRLWPIVEFVALNA